MASVTSLTTSSSSSTSSLYGNRNILTGLASGMDTESMIENSIVGYKTKIQSLIQQQTKLAWKQDAYREITDKLIALSEKYTSYTSKTNLASNSFFNNAIKQTVDGTYASKVAATGRTDSDVTLNAVKQLASAARYSVSGKDQFGTDGTATGTAVNMSSVKENKLSGSITFGVGGDSVTVDFGSGEAYESIDDMVAAINTKLREQESGANKIVATRSGNSIQFTAGDAASSGDSVWIKSASGKIASTLGITGTATLSAESTSSIDLSKAGSSLYEVKSAWSALSNKTVSVTLDGVTRKVSLGDLNITAEDRANGIEDIKDKLVSNLQSGLKNAFGDKVTVEMKDGALSFKTAENNSTLKVSSEVGSALGLGSGIMNYTDTTRTLGDLLGSKLNGLTANEDGSYDLVLNDKLVGTFTKDSALESVMTAINRSEAGVKVSYSSMTDKFTFTASETGSQGRVDFAQGLGTALFGEAKTNKSASGILLDGNGEKVAAGTFVTPSGTTQNYYIREENGKYYRVDDDNVEIDVGRTTNLETGETTYSTYSIDELNRMPDDSRPGADAQKEIAAALERAKENARAGFTAGQDAVFNVTVNGDNMTLTRGSNVVTIDGLSITLKGAFNEDFTVDQRGVVSASKADAQGNKTMQVLEQEDKVTFTENSDADTIVDAVKSFVEQVNDIMKNVHDAYTTQPLNKSSSSTKYTTYEPLTDDDKADMTETEIKNYEEKAKTGLLFSDGDLSRLYNQLRTNISLTGTDRVALEAIGLTTTYENGVTTLSLDEDKLRAALAANPDSVREIFTKTKENGASTDGLMAGFTKTIKTYASTTTGSYGVLVRKAGTRTKSLTLNNNTLQDQIDRLDTQIDTWQTKMSNKIDYYTRQFTALETLMSEMNSQSSTLSSLMGY